MLDWYKKSQDEGNELGESLSNFRPQSLRGLAAEAIKAGSFEEFQRDYTLEHKQGTYWHITDNPNFTIDPENGHRDRGSMSVSDKPEKGSLMVTSHLENWIPYFKDRKYVAEIDLSRVGRDQYFQSNRGFGNEFMITDASKARVIRVVPLENAVKTDRYLFSKRPIGLEGLKKFYDGVVASFSETRPNKEISNA